MSTLKVLVVDDEPLARRRLMRMLQRLDDIEVMGEAGDGEQALALIRSPSAQAPDLVLLDINMPQMDGLELAEEPGLPPIVFTTAHAEHALRAFELAAVDYLLKPVSRERLVDAIERVRARPGRTTPTADDSLRITARRGSTVHVVDAREITRFHSEDKYTVFAHQGRELLIDDSLSTLEQRLAAHGFLRVHRAELINLSAVAALHAEDGSTRVELSDGSEAAVSRRLVGELKRRLGIG